MAIRAVIFDCFGVLWSCKLPQTFAQYTQNDPEKRRLYSHYCMQADRGEISSQQLWVHIAEIMGLTIGECLRIINAERHLNHELVQYIREDLRGSYKIGLLSNAGKDIWHYVTPDLQELFDVRLISADLRRTKPDREVYLEMCRQLGVLPEEAVMVDDSLDNCIGARQAGLSAVEYQSFAQLRNELPDALIVV